jgi:glutathione S-transferase
VTLTLYMRPGTCSVASLIAIEEAGAPRQVVFVGPERDGWADYLKKNPKGTAPALEAEGIVFTETIAIVSYVARLYPEAKLLPDDPLQLSSCLSLMAWFASTVHVTRRQAHRPQAFTADAAAQVPLAAEGRAKFWDNLTKIDALLAGKTWLMGEAFTAADGHALVFYSWGLRDGHPMRELTAFTAWKDRMLARPRTRRALEVEGNAPLQAEA